MKLADIDTIVARISALEAQIKALKNDPKIVELSDMFDKICNKMFEDSGYNSAGYWVEKNFSLTEESTFRIMGDGWCGPESQGYWEIPLEYVMRAINKPEEFSQICNEIWEDCR